MIFTSGYDCANVWSSCAAKAAYESLAGKWIQYCAMIRVLLISSFLTISGLFAARPNVVMLLADDLGWQDLGCYGGPVNTPTLDALAQQGTRFTQFYSGAAVCSPSRATLLTGRHHIRAGIYSWVHDETQRSHLLEREITLAEVLKEAGYATAHIGKWHLGLSMPHRKKPSPADHGFDYWFATHNNAHPSHHNPNNFIRNGEMVGAIEGYSCQIVVDEAIHWLDAHREKDKPFFLNVWFHEPHAPIAAPDSIVAGYGAPDDKGAIYSGTIDNTDRAIARLLKVLHQIDEPENTLIIYASDNGSYRKDRVGGLRGQKGVNWEGGIRVPGIYFWPGHLPGGRVETTPSGLVDVLPTVCGLLGIHNPEVHLDGSDVSSVLTQRGSFHRHQPLFWHLQRSKPIVALRDGDYSLVAGRAYDLSRNNLFSESWIPAIKSGTYKNYQLFNLVNDPAQTTDISAGNPGIVARMKQDLLRINQSIMADGPDWHLAP